MSDKDLIIDFPKQEEPESDEYVVYGEVEAYSVQNNVYYRIPDGSKYKIIWHNNRRLKVEEVVQAVEDKGTNIYLCGVSDDPFTIEDYECNASKKGVRFCRPFDREIRTIDVAPDLIGKKWNEEALAYLECVNPKFLSVYRPYKGGTLLPHQWELGEVQVTVNEVDNIISVKKRTYVGIVEE